LESFLIKRYFLRVLSASALSHLIDCRQGIARTFIGVLNQNREVVMSMNMVTSCELGNTALPLVSVQAVPIVETIQDAEAEFSFNAFRHHC
jgi:hypothetical protein